MNEPQFTQSGTTPIYWLDPATRVVAYFASPSASYPSPVTLTQSWSDAEGVYVFLGCAPSDDVSFAAALRTYLQQLGWPNGPRFLWLVNPTISPFNWNGTAVNLTSAPLTVKRRADFALANYSVSVLSGSTVSLVGSTTSEWGFSFVQQQPTPIVMAAPGGTFPSSAQSILLSFEHPGAWRFPIVAAAATSTTQSGLAALDCTMRFFYPDAAGEFVKAITLQPLVQGAAAITLFATVNPLAPLDSTRTAFSFIPFGGGSGPGPLQSGYATALGYGVTLTPQPAASGIADAGFGFAFHPLAIGDPGKVPGNYYLAPTGAFAITVNTTSERGGQTPTNMYRLLCGASGLEYVGLPSSGNAGQLVFFPGAAAFAPGAHDPDEDVPPLTALGTTSWCGLTASTSLTYFSQPQDAPLYKHPLSQQQDGSTLLNFFEIPTVQLPAPSATTAFPMAPYIGLDAVQSDDARELENRALCPARRNVILNATSSRWSTESGRITDGTVTVGVTPQGLSVGVGTNAWSWLGLGNDAIAGAASPDLVFTKVGGTLRQAVQTNALFMVLGDPTTFFSSSDVAYQLTKLDINIIATLPTGQGVGPQVLQAVRTYFDAQQYPVFQFEADFVTALQTAYPGMSAADVLVFQRYAGLLTPKIEDWQFQISPRNWLNPLRTEQPNTYLLFKFALGATLYNLVSDTSRWAWADASSSKGPSAAQAAILGVFDAAIQKAESPDSPYRHFAALVNDPNWTGILALSCTVPLDGLPDALQTLAAGIDPKRFYAHHIGFNITPCQATTTEIEFGRTSMFGLIDYNDDVDQYFSTDISFAFKVLRLTVQFQNSAVSGFSSRVELMLNRLFGTSTHLYPTLHGNNVILDGVYQRQRLPDGTEQRTYLFGMTGHTLVRLENTALQAVDLLSTQLVTLKPASVATGDATVASSFALAGNLWFYEAPGFDIFSWGPLPTPGGEDGPFTSDSYLRFGNLRIGMTFSLGDPTGTTAFSLHDEALTFDMANSIARGNAFIRRFPAQLESLAATPDPVLSQNAVETNPEDQGYVSISAPINQSVLQQPWYGLVYRIDLGSLGALAAATGISLRVLAAWSPGGTLEQPNVYVGVRLPGTQDAIGVSLPLQGILDLGFRSVAMHALTDETTGDAEYSMRLRDFALRILGWSFPPGHNDVYLFGNPDQTANTKLGWYAAYSKEEDKKKSQQATRLREQIRARRLVAAVNRHRDNAP